LLACWIPCDSKVDAEGIGLSGWVAKKRYKYPTPGASEVIFQQQMALNEEREGEEIGSCGGGVCLQILLVILFLGLRGNATKVLRINISHQNGLKATKGTCGRGEANLLRHHLSLCFFLVINFAILFSCQQRSFHFCYHRYLTLPELQEAMRRREVKGTSTQLSLLLIFMMVGLSTRICARGITTSKYRGRIQ